MALTRIAPDTGSVLKPGPMNVAPPDFAATPFGPRRYVVYRTPSPIEIDGRLDDRAWSSAEQPCMSRNSI